MAQHEDVAAIVNQLMSDWGDKVIVDWQDFWSEHPELLDVADGILSDMSGLYKSLVALGGS